MKHAVAQKKSGVIRNHLASVRIKAFSIRNPVSSVRHEHGSLRKRVCVARHSPGVLRKNGFIVRQELYAKRQRVQVVRKSRFVILKKPVVAPFEEKTCHSERGEEPLTIFFFPTADAGDRRKESEILRKLRMTGFFQTAPLPKNRCPQRRGIAAAQSVSCMTVP